MVAIDGSETNRTHEPKGIKKPEQHKPNIIRRRAVAMGAILLATVIGANQLKAKDSTPLKTAAVKEYVVRGGDNPWTLALRAFPKDANNPSRQYNIRQEIIAELPNDLRHKNGVLQPGDRLVLRDNAKIGDEVTYQEALDDISRSSSRQNIEHPVG